MKKILALSLSAIFLCGCFTPTRKIVGAKIGVDPKTGAITWDLSQDAKWSWMHYENINGSNRISLTVSNGVFKTNPEVLSKNTEHDVGLATAVGEQVNKGVEMGLKAAGKAVVPIP